MALHDIPLRRVLPQFVALYVPLALLLVALGFWYVHERHEITLAHYRTEARHHVEGQVERIQRFYRQGLLMVRGFARDSAVRPALHGDQAAQKEIAWVFANILRSLDTLGQLRLLDARGREVVRVERRGSSVIRVPASGLQDKAHRDYVRRALAMPPGSMYVSPLDVNMEHGRIERPYKAVVRFVAVVGGGNDRVAGLLVANFPGMKLMTLELDETRMPGEHLLVNAGSEWWFDSHQNRLETLRGEAALLTKHRLGDAWRHLMTLREGQITTGAALLTVARYRPDGAHDPPRVSVHPSPIQPEWRIVSWVPLRMMWSNAAVAETTLTVLAMLALTGAALLLWVRYRLWRKDTEQQREAMMRANQRLLRRLLRAQEEERARLARMMHDECGQRLTGIRMRAAVAEKRCQTEDGCDAARTALAHVRREVDELAQLMRDRLRSFRPPPVRELGLTGAMKGYCKQWSRDAGIRCETQVDAAADTLPHDRQIQLYRIMQEALTNVARHAGASSVRLRLGMEGSELLLVIEDDGEHFNPEHAADGLGLAGMRERAQLLHGSLCLERTQRGGARLVLRAPVFNESAKS